MYLIYSCVFNQREYIKILELLLESYALAVKDTSKYTYLIITNNDFQPDIEILCKRLNINYDIWCLDIINEKLINESLTDIDCMFQACYSRFYIFDYPNISNFEKILYLDCDLLVVSDLLRLFETELENKYDHCFFFTDEEFQKLDKSKTFTTAILLFNNNNKIQDIMEKNLSIIKKFQKDYRRAPPCFDQPFINKYCIDNKVSENSFLSSYCLNILPNDTIDKIQQINLFLICHFATAVGGYQEKINRMQYSFQLIKYMRSTPLFP